MISYPGTLGFHISQIIGIGGLDLLFHAARKKAHSLTIPTTFSTTSSTLGLEK